MTYLEEPVSRTQNNKYLQEGKGNRGKSYDKKKIRERIKSHSKDETEAKYKMVQIGRECQGEPELTINV